VLLVLIAMCAARIAVAQEGTWETVPADELALKQEPKAPGAAAIILYRRLDIDDKKSNLTESTRIKVLTDPQLQEFRFVVDANLG